MPRCARPLSVRAEDVGLANGVIRVEFGWEYRDGQIPLKSNAGRRKVPIPAVLRSFLETRFAECGYSGADRLFAFVFAASPFDPGELTKRAETGPGPLPGLSALRFTSAAIPSPR